MIKRLLGIFLFLSLSIGGVWGQLNANFSTNPLYNSSNQLNVCAGSSVLFTFISTGSNITPTTVVNWTFTTISGTALSQSSSTLRTPFPITFPNGTYTISLQLSEPSGTSSIKTITVNATSIPPSTPGLSLSAFSATSGWSSTVIAGVPSFSICPVNLNLTQDVTFDITPALTCSQVSSITHTEVPSSTLIDCSSGNFDITYNPNTARFYYSVFAVQFSGCVFSRVYYVQIGTPSISITSASSTACDPGTYSLAFTDQTPGVTYQIDWDYNGSSFNSQAVYSYPNLPLNPQKVSHSYPFTPCVNNTVQPNEIKIRASNTTCAGYSETSPSQVFVSQAPDANFTRTPNLDVICQGTQVTYTDNSYPGVYVAAPGNCNTQYHKWWTHTPAAFGSGTTNTSNVSNLGGSSNSNPGPSTFSVTYNQPGNYVIRLIVKNNSCGNDTIIKTVCVVPAVNANFNPNVTSGCAPLAITTTNNSSLPGCSGTNMLYNWSVTNAPPTCGTPAWNFSNGTNSNSANPQFNFSGPGVYTVKLVSSLNPAVPGAQCQNDTITQTITVKEKPVVSITAPSAICQNQTFTPVATVNSCYTSSSSYAWTFNNGSPTTSNIINPGSVLYANNGNFTFSLAATNECGTQTQSSTITVNQQAVVDAGNYSVSCSGSSIQLTGSVTGGATGGTWSSSSGGLFQPNANTLNATFVPPAGATGNITLTLTATGIISPCPSVNDVASINLNATPFVNAGNDTSICAGALVQLNGTIGGTATSATWSTLGSGTFSNVGSLTTTYNPSSADITSGTVALVLTTNDPIGPCPSTKDTIHVTIKPIPSLTLGSINSVCSGNAFSIPLIPSISSPPASYTWSLIAPNPLPSGVSTLTSGSISAPATSMSGTATNTTNNPVQLQYNIVPIVNGCSGPAAVANVTINPIPQPLITPPGPTTACNGTTVTLTTSNFSSYLWSNGGTGQSITVNSAGNYSVTVTNSYGCTGSSPISSVNFSVPINPIFNQIPAICYNGTFSLPSTSTNGISGTWSPAVNNLATTTYTFTPSSGQCANPTDMLITVNPLPTPTVTANGPLTFCQGSSVILSASGGGTYIWYQNGTAIPNATSSTLTVSQSGNYTVQVTNANGCSAISNVQAVVVNLNPQPVIAPSSPVTNCQGTPVILSTSSNFSTYSWFQGSSSSTLGGNDSLTITTAGLYTVSVTNANGCSGTSAPFVFQTTAPVLPTFTSIAPICAGGTFTLQNTSNNGISGFWTPTPNYNTTTLYTFTPLTGSCALPTTLNVVVNPQPTISATGSTICSGSSTAINATPSITGGTYSWSNGPTTQAINVNPITNTTYTVTYLLNGCSASDTAQITVVQSPTVTIPPVTICQGQSATLNPTVNPTGGTYLWNNNQSTSSISVSPSTNTTYNLTYSINGCQSIATNVLVTVNPLPTATLSPTSICAGQNTILTPVVSPSGGTYLWSTNQTTPSITVNPTSSTTYTLVYTSNGCASNTASTTISVTPLPIITAPNATICSGQSTTLNSTVNIPGGTYSWSPNTALSSSTIANPIANPNNSQQYTVTYTANGCTSLPDTVLVSVIQNIQATVNNATICNGASATLTANPANASYLWSNGSTSQTISVSPNSNQSFSVTVSAAGCPSSSATATVTVNPIPSVSVANVNAICNGSSTTLTATPSALGGTYLWSNGLSGATINVTPALTNPTLAQNFNYSVVYTLNGCPSIADTVTVAVNPVPTVSLPTTTTICNGSGDTLVATVNLTGGTYLWTNGATTPQIIVNPTTNTNYSVTYTLNGCSATSATTTGNVVVNPIPTANITGPASVCAGQQATLTATPSAPGGTYLWSNGATSATINVNPTSTTTYSVVYTLNSCASTAATYSVTVNPIPTLNVPDTTICGGLSVALTANPTPTGGTYLWSANANSATTNQVTVTPATTTTYSVAYTANGCTANDNVTVTVIQNPVATLANQTICFGQSTTLVAGPNGANYSWSTGQTTQTLTVNPTVTTTYTVTVNIGGCAATSATATVTVNPIPSVSVANVNAICNGSSTTLTATPSAPGGTYLWSNGLSGATINVTPALTNPTLAQNFNYSVVYTLNGCPSIADTVTVAVNPVPTVSLPTTTTICNGSGDTLVATVNLTGGTYLWTNGATTPQIIVNPTTNTNYSVTYTLNGCSATSATTTGNVVVNPIPTANITGPASVCAGQQATLTATPSAPGGTYLWSNGATSATINVNPTSTTTYSVVYTLNSCASTAATYSVTVNPIPTLNVPDTTICGGLSVALTANPTPTGGTYLWSANANSATTNQVTVTPATTTTYSVAYTANGCTANDNVTVTVIQNPVATLANQTICFGQSTTLVAGPNGANYSWSTGQTTQTLTVNPTVTTTYTVTVNIGGCAATSATATVTVNPIPSVSVANVNAICNGSSTTLTATPSAPGGTYLWSNGLSGATINVTPALTNPTLAQNFNYSVVYTLNGCPSIADTVTVAVNPVPTVSFNDTTICSGNSATLTATPNILGGNYLWNTGATTQQINVSPSITTAYTIIYNLNGCNDTITDSVYVNPIPSVQINQNPTICYGETATLTSTVSPANGTYLWSGYGLSGINNQNQVSVSPQNGNATQNAIHLYQLIYTLNGCIDTAFSSINVNLIPSVVGNASQSTICPGESVILNGVGNPTTSNGNTGTYVWYTTNPIDTIATSSTVTVNPTTNTTYQVVYTINGCESPAFPVSILIQTAPQITIQNNPNATICEGGCVTLSAVPSTSTIVPSGYSWSTGETTQSIIVCPTDTATYTVIGLSGTCQSPVATTVVNVTSDPVFTTAIIPDTTICVGGSFTFNVDVSGGVGTPTYQWYLNNVPNNSGGAPISNSNNNSYSTPTILQPTTQYYYTLISYPGVGCDHLTSPIAELNVISDPVVTINPLFNQTLCEGGIAECIVPEVFGGIGNTTFLWMPSMTADSIYCPPTNQIGTQNYNVLVQQSGIGCGSLPSNSVAITVVPDPTIQIVGTPNVCVGAEVPLVTSVQGGIGSVANYQWSSSYPNGNPYQDITGANGFNYTTIPLDDQIGIVVNMNQTGVGCNASDTFEINVFADPLVSIMGDSMTCIGLTNNLQALVTGGVPNSTNMFTWFNTGTLFNPTPVIVQATSLLDQYTSTILSDTSYFVVVDNSGLGCDNDTSTIFDIDAIEWAIAGFDIEPENGSQSILTPTFSFINTSQNSTSYFWDLGECDPQLPLSELFFTPSPSYNPTSEDQINYTYGCSPGYYDVTLYAFNQGMCPDTITEVIRIRDEIIVYVPNAFTPGYLDNFNNSFYPVITGKIKPGTYRFTIFNRWGEIVFDSYDPNEVWDGKYFRTNYAKSGTLLNDDFVQDGVYTWTLSFIAEEGGTKKEYNGHVTKLQSDLEN